MSQFVNPLLVMSEVHPLNALILRPHRSSFSGFRFLWGLNNIRCIGLKGLHFLSRFYGEIYRLVLLKVLSLVYSASYMVAVIQRIPARN